MPELQVYPPASRNIWIVFPKQRDTGGKEALKFSTADVLLSFAEDFAEWLQRPKEGLLGNPKDFEQKF